jgi:uncharacterized protein
VAKFSIDKAFQEAAERGDPFAQFELGISLDNGDNGDQNFEEAAAWYAKAVDQGHESAEINLLLLHVFGRAHSLRPEIVVTRLHELAQTGDLDAQNNLGLCYQLGYGTPQNYLEAASWFRRAAQSGLGTAQFNLGGLYYEGWGFEKNLAKAIEWYTRAAQQREELALLQLGRMYQKGIGVELNLNRAFTLFLIAYRRGSLRAANHLGSMFKKGLGTERDDEIAYELYLESVSGPDTADSPENLSYRATAYYWLGYMTEHGEGVERNLRYAKRWYSRGAAFHQSHCVEAMNRLRSTASDIRCRNKRT